MSKPQIILNAGCAAIAMAIAYRLANLMIDRVLPKKKVEEEEPADEPKAHPALDLLQMCVNGDVDAARLLLALAPVRGFLLFSLPLGQHAVDHEVGHAVGDDHGNGRASRIQDELGLGHRSGSCPPLPRAGSATSCAVRVGKNKCVWGASSTPARRPRRIFPSLHASRSLARFCGSRHRRLVLLHELCRAARLPASRSATGYEACGRPAPAPSTEALASDRFLK